MKKYVSAILIPCLLLQLCGCYSFREVTIDEFKKYNGEDDVKIITEEAEFILNRDSTKKNKLNWILNDSSIIMQEKTSMMYKYDNSNPDKKNEIKFTEIKSVSINEHDSGKTGLILGVVMISAIIVGFIVLLIAGKPSFGID
jgi:hypothetical protein